jgi:hypothetical protein
MDLPIGFALIYEDSNYKTLNYQIGAHFGGEGEIKVPTSLFSKFCENRKWRTDMVSKYGKVIYLGTEQCQVDIPESEKGKTGVIPLEDF